MIRSLFKKNSDFDSLVCSLIEKEKENLRNSIGKFNEELAPHAGFVEKINRNIKKLEREEKELTEKIKENTKQGNTSVAQQLEEALSEQKRQIEFFKERYNYADNLFQKLSRSRDLAVSNAQHKIRNIENTLIEIRVCEAQCELQEGHVCTDDFANATCSELNTIELLVKFKLLYLKEKLNNLGNSSDYIPYDFVWEAFKELEKQMRNNPDVVKKQKE